MKVTFIKGEQYEETRQKGLLDIKQKVIAYIEENKPEQKIAK